MGVSTKCLFCGRELKNASNERLKQSIRAHMKTCPVKRNGLIYRFNATARGFRIWPQTYRDYVAVNENFQLIFNDFIEKGVGVQNVVFFAYLKAKFEDKRLVFELVDSKTECASTKDNGNGG